MFADPSSQGMGWIKTSHGVGKAKEYCRHYYRQHFGPFHSQKLRETRAKHTLTRFLRPCRPYFSMKWAASLS